MTDLIRECVERLSEAGYDELAEALLAAQAPATTPSGPDANLVADLKRAAMLIGHHIDPALGNAVLAAMQRVLDHPTPTPPPADCVEVRIAVAMGTDSDGDRVGRADLIHPDYSDGDAMLITGCALKTEWLTHQCIAVVRVPRCQVPVIVGTVEPVEVNP